MINRWLSTTFSLFKYLSNTNAPSETPTPSEKTTNYQVEAISRLITLIKLKYRTSLAFAHKQSLDCALFPHELIPSEFLDALDHEIMTVPMIIDPLENKKEGDEEHDHIIDITSLETYFGKLDKDTITPAALINPWTRQAIDPTKICVDLDKYRCISEFMLEFGAPALLDDKDPAVLKHKIYRLLCTFIKQVQEHKVAYKKEIAGIGAKKKKLLETNGTVVKKAQLKKQITQDYYGQLNELIQRFHADYKTMIDSNPNISSKEFSDCKELINTFIQDADSLTNNLSPNSEAINAISSTQIYEALKKIVGDFLLKINEHRCNTLKPLVDAFMQQQKTQKEFMHKMQQHQKDEKEKLEQEKCELQKFAAERKKTQDQLDTFMSTIEGREPTNSEEVMIKSLTDTLDIIDAKADIARSDHTTDELEKKINVLLGKREAGNFTENDESLLDFLLQKLIAINNNQTQFKNLSLFNRYAYSMYNKDAGIHALLNAAATVATSNSQASADIVRRFLPIICR